MNKEIESRGWKAAGQEHHPRRDHDNTKSKQTPWPATLCNRTLFYLPSHIPFLLVLLYHLFHEADVVELGQIAVLEHVGAFMLGHGLDQVFDDFVGDERMTEVEFGDVGLLSC